MLRLRHFQPSEDEYAFAVDVFNAAWPDDRQSVRNWQIRDETWAKDYLWQRFVGEIESRMVVEGVYFEPFWSARPGKFQFGFSVHPDYKDYTEDGQSIYALIYHFILAQLTDRSPTSIWCGSREDRSEIMAFLEEQGFEFRMRFPHSELEVDAFDFTPFDGVREHVQEQGIEIYTLATLRERDPNWLTRVYDMCWEIEQDVPSPEPPTRLPLDEWQKVFENPDFLPEGWFIALDRGRFVGISMLAINAAQPDKMHTWLTGVVRTHRRRGIATALKLRAIELARTRGVKRIETGNEENNPMYELNIALGFKPKPAWRDFEKKLESNS